MKMKRLFFGVCLAIAISLVWLPVHATDVDDITKEVLTGPAHLDPSKILGPGGVGINTHKNILMSFGATVRMIPVFESNWDFGVSEKVGEGYFYTEPFKNYAGNALTTGKAVQGIYSTSRAFDNALNRGGSGIENADVAIVNSFNEFANALSYADDVTKSRHPSINPFASGAASIQDVAGTVSDNASAAFAAGGAAGLNQAATAAETNYAAAAAAAAANPGDAALQALARGAAGVAYGLRTASDTVAANPASGTSAGTIASAATIQAMAQGGNLVQNADALAAGFAVQVTNKPDASSANLTDAIAYLNNLKATADSFQPYYLANSFLRTHKTETGYVNDDYIRTEVKLYFNAMPKDKKWSFYAALEYDRPIDTLSVDSRGGKTDNSSNFGLERLNASIELFPGLRLHGGWDVWALDAIESASMVYGDDNAGFWLRGDYGKIAFSTAWLKLEENDFQNNFQDHNASVDEDRNLFAGYFDYRFDGTDKNKIRLFYALDRIRNVPSLDLTAAMASEANDLLTNYAGIYGNNGVPRAKATSPDVDAHTIGGYWLGDFGVVKLMAEGAYKFGSADDTGLKGVNNGVRNIEYDDFDISSYAFAADIGFELKDVVGWHSLKPHIGIMYTSGDDDPEDDKLGGFNGVQNVQRYSEIWGGENTIIGDTNFILGTPLYSYIPELYGNGTPVFVGGLQNMAGQGNGRGDNPGVTMYSLGLTLRPKIYLIYKTNVNMFYWNEDFYVGNMVSPILYNEATGSLSKNPYTAIESGFAGTEWDNEIILALSKHMYIKFQGSFFFPGERVEDVTAALTGGEKSDEVASRIGGELIWNF